MAGSLQLISVGKMVHDNKSMIIAGGTCLVCCIVEVLLGV